MNWKGWGIAAILGATAATVLEWGEPLNPYGLGERVGAFLTSWLISAALVKIATIMVRRLGLGRSA